MASYIPLASGSAVPLPPGYKFYPTDQEIVVCYLRCRAVNQPLPSTVIADKDILDHHPADLVPETCSEKYYFYRRVMRWENSTRWKREAKGGYWKLSGNEIPIYCTNSLSGAPLIVGMKSTLVFYNGKQTSGEPTDWVMQEYRLSGDGLSPYHVTIPCMNNNSGESCGSVEVTNKEHDDPALTPSVKGPSIENANIVLNPDSSWVVCHIHKKRARNTPVTIRTNNGVDGKIPFFDFLGLGNPDGGTACSNVLHVEKKNSEL